MHLADPCARRKHTAANTNTAHTAAFSVASPISPSPLNPRARSHHRCQRWCQASKYRSSPPASQPTLNPYPHTPISPTPPHLHTPPGAALATSPAASAAARAADKHMSRAAPPHLSVQPAGMSTSQPAEMSTGAPVQMASLLPYSLIRRRPLAPDPPPLDQIPSLLRAASLRCRGAGRGAARRGRLCLRAPRKRAGCASRAAGGAGGAAPRARRARGETRGATRPPGMGRGVVSVDGA